MSDHQDPPLSIPQAARKLGVSDQATRLALIRGELRGFRVGKAWRILPESVAQLMAACRSEEVA